jgi:hypothetical protein
VRHGVGGVTVTPNEDGGLTVLGVVPDAVLNVHLGDLRIPVSNNVFLADVDELPDEIGLVTSTGVRSWRFPGGAT